MLSLSFTVPLTIISFIALIINVIILFVVILCKQVSPSNILLFHLSVIESLLCIIFLVLSVPLLTRNDEFAAPHPICSLNAFFITLLHPIALWTVCGLNCDRYYAIAAPLHYNAKVSSKKVICGLACGWVVALLATIPPFFDVAPYTNYKDTGVCGPNFSAENSLWYAITFTVITFGLPGSLIVMCNIKVFMIARYHRHRIAAAIFEVTLSAQVTITHQRNPFPLPFEAIPPKLRARSPMASVFQIVGSFILLYCPYYVIILWNSSLASLHNGNIPKSLELPCIVTILAFTLIHLTVFVNIIIYGLKSKVMRKSVQNYWRKKKTKSEINNEIQARTPSTCGSRRPSINASTMNFSHRRLSETCINMNQNGTGNRPQMKRIASELSWRPLTLQLDNSPTDPLPHSSSANTLQIPSCEIETMDVGTERKFMNFRDAVEGPIKPTHLHNMSSRHSKSSINIATALLQKVFRIDLNDSFRCTSARNEPLSPLRSPQILITSAYSDEIDPTSHSPFKAESRTHQLITNLFDNANHVDLEHDDRVEESDTDMLADMHSSFSKRCLSLDDTPKYESCDMEEQLLLSWPTTRKKYKLLKEYEPNVNPLFNDRCEEPEVVL